MRKESFIKNIPNCLTFLNLLTGLAAIVFLIRIDNNGNAAIAALLIMIGGVLDLLDGHTARRLNASSEFGKQLDSFSDLTTFGIAPVCLVHSISELSIFIILSSALFVIAGIYRLARYNISDFSAHFMGMPITVAGLLLAIYCTAYPALTNVLHSGICTAITTVLITLLSVMMVSKVKVRRLFSKK